MTILQSRKGERGEKMKKRTTVDVLREIDTELVTCNMGFPEKQEALRIVRNKLNEEMCGTLGPNAPPVIRLTVLMGCAKFFEKEGEIVELLKKKDKLIDLQCAAIESLNKQLAVKSQAINDNYNRWADTDAELAGVKQSRVKAQKEDERVRLRLHIAFKKLEEIKEWFERHGDNIEIHNGSISLGLNDYMKA